MLTVSIKPPADMDTAVDAMLSLGRSPSHGIAMPGDAGGAFEDENDAINEVHLRDGAGCRNLTLPAIDV